MGELLLGHPCGFSAKSGITEGGYMKRNVIQIILYPGDESGYVAECVSLPVVTQGATIDETVKNMQEALALHLDGENLEDLELSPNAPLIVSMELNPIHA
jgi:predicted RNase H-like HicB family nuclease